MTRPYQSDRGSPLSRSFLPLALITVGVVFLLGNVLPERSKGSLVLIGLGAAFLIGRVTTGRYGYAVPAGILLAIGTYVGIQDLQVLQVSRGPGLFFILLGLGFALVYLIGSQPAAVWPMFPATILVGLGVVVYGATVLAPLAAFSWLVSFWPVALVLLGVWLLFRDYLPAGARRPLATLGGLALLAYGILAAATSVASGGALARTGFSPSFGSSPFTDTVALDAPISSGQMLTVNNSSGRTTVHPGTGPDVHVMATRHYSIGGEPPEVRLAPGAGGVSLDSSGPGGRPYFFNSNFVDYAIEMPAAAGLKLKTGSGQVEVDGIDGAVQADTGSGSLTLSHLTGAVDARSSSGSIQLTEIAGDLKVNTTSGRIQGTGLMHVREARASSGHISLEGIFTDPAQIRASSGAIDLKLLPGSAVKLDARADSGSVVPTGLINLTGGSTSQHRLSGSIGNAAPDATLSIETSSGSITISQ